MRQISPLAAALQRVGDRWTLLLVAELLDGPKRFGELQEVVPGIATNVLASRLRELERHGLVVGTPYSRRPLRFEYELSRAGAELAGALRLLAAWGAASGPPPQEDRAGEQDRGHRGDRGGGPDGGVDGAAAVRRGSGRAAVRRPSPRGSDAAQDPAEVLVPVHVACGTPLEVRQWCPTCQMPANDDDEVWL